MRIAIAGIVHETNTYCPGLTTNSAFYTYRGERMLSTSGQQSDVGGAVDAVRAAGREVVPLLYASTQPSATIERETYEGFKDEILTGLHQALSAGLDGCVLTLHGAGVVDGIEDLEGDLAWAVREVLGDLPIAASFDLHGNVTQHMADALNGMFACHHYPHIDLHERAAEAVRCVIDMAEGRPRTVCDVLALPLLLPTTTTYEGIGETLLNELLALEEVQDCLDISWFHGFPYTDIAHVGSMISITRNHDDEKSLHAARDFARRLWEAREEFRPLSLSGAQAIDAARAHDRYPVVIHETSDNCGAGTPGDGTHLLRAMLDAQLGAQACFGFIVDAEVAAQAHAAGIGSTIEVALGGKTDDLHGDTLQLSAYVKALHDGRVVMQHMFKGAPLNLGPLARLVVDDMDIIVASRRSQTFDTEPFLAVGIDVTKYKYVALKSSNHFRAGFSHIASAIVTADTPGLSTHNISVFPRQKTTRRLWPIHGDATYPE
ncbi:MAG: M81 family metallopeptidase [Pseudomonadota bacterium]